MSEPTKPRIMLSKQTITLLRVLEILTVIGTVAAIVIADIPWLFFTIVIVLITDKVLDRHVWNIRTWLQAQWRWEESVVQSIILEASSVSRVEKNLQLPSQFSVRLQNGHRFTLTDQLWAHLGQGLVVKYEVRKLDEEFEFRNITPA